MKKVLVFLFLFTPMLFSFNVFSKEVISSEVEEDSTVQKSVNIFGTDLSSKSNDIKLKYEAGSGLEFKGGDAFKLNIGARIQFRFESAEKNQEKRGPTSSDGSEGTSHDFQTRRFQLTFNGYAYSPDIFYKYSICSDKNGTGCVGADGFGIEDAYFGYKTGEVLRLTVGQMHVPHTLEALTSSSKLTFVDRSSKHLTFERDHGIKLDLSMPNKTLMLTGFLGAGLGGNNARGSSQADVWDKIYVTRIEWTPFGKMKYGQVDLKKSDEMKLRIGASQLWWNGLNVYYTGSAFKEEDGTTSLGHSGKLDDRIEDIATAYSKNGKTALTGVTYLDISSRTYDVGFKYKGLSGEFEYTTLTGDESILGYGKESLDWARIQGNYHITNGWVAGYRYGVRDNSDQKKDKILEHTYQVSKYFVGHNLKINADYGYINEQQLTGDDKQTRTIRVQAQLKF
ncbi:hypothetical protein HN460_02335 [bacterium]|nr:hypothetical protein [bacterium]MBT3795035.1 hypothetical protein [bacterium]MBT4634663.1 hypothetical protein [bacterium]